MGNITTSADHVQLVDHRSTIAGTFDSPIASLSASETSCTDHILIWQWHHATGWAAPEIRPYGPLPLMPGASVLQYATECFEGIKIYRGYDDQLRLFRIRLNCERMLKSSLRVGLPAMHTPRLESMLAQFGAIEAEKWLPKGQVGQTLYLRPTHIGTTSALGVRKPRNSLLYVIATRMPGFSTNGKGMKLLASPESIVRAWPGGFGDAKLGANYGPTLVAHDEAIRDGFDQVLWLSGDQRFITEAGASNFFIIWRTSDGEVQLVTPPLDAGTILEGVTRRSVLELVRSKYHQPSLWTSSGQSLSPLVAIEREFDMNEVKAAWEEGRLLEAFATGTAYFIAPVELIRYENEDIILSLPPDESGSYAMLIKGWLSDIVFGVVDHEGWTKIIEVVE